MEAELVHYVKSLRPITNVDEAARVAQVSGNLNGNTYISYGFDCTVLIIGPPNDAHDDIVYDVVRKLNTINVA